MTFHNVRLLTTIFSVAGAFFAFVAGGWSPPASSGTRRAEPAHLHGVHRVAGHHPLMLLLAALAPRMWAPGTAGWWRRRLGATPPTTPEDRRRGS